MLFKSNKVIGLDIGTSSIKLAELDMGKGSAKLTGFGMIKTPPTAIVGGDIIEQQPISDAIRQLILDTQVKRKQCAAGLWGPSVIVKKITIPKMDKKLVAEQIRWEAEQYIPFEMNEVNLDFHVLENISNQHDSMDILLIAARHEQIFKTIEIIEHSGLQCTHLDINGFALSNCFHRNMGSTNGEMVVVINIGASYINLIIIRDDDLIFSRDIPIGGALYTSEIQKVMGVSPSEAESLKINVSRGQPTPDEVGHILNSTHEVICDEIKGSIDFFINTTPGSSVSKCYITGGGCKTAGLLSYLTQNLGISCETFNPFTKIPSKLKSGGNQFLKEISDYSSIVIGLALRKIGDEC